VILHDAACVRDFQVPHKTPTTGPRTGWPSRHAGEGWRPGTRTDPRERAVRRACHRRGYLPGHQDRAHAENCQCRPHAGGRRAGAGDDLGSGQRRMSAPPPASSTAHGQPPTKHARFQLPARWRQGCSSAVLITRPVNEAGVAWRVAARFQAAPVAERLALVAACPGENGGCRTSGQVCCI